MATQPNTRRLLGLKLDLHFAVLVGVMGRVGIRVRGRITGRGRGRVAVVVTATFTVGVTVVVIVRVTSSCSAGVRVGISIRVRVRVVIRPPFVGWMLRRRFCLCNDIMTG